MYIMRQINYSLLDRLMTFLMSLTRVKSCENFETPDFMFVLFDEIKFNYQCASVRVTPCKLQCNTDEKAYEGGMRRELPRRKMEMRFTIGPCNFSNLNLILGAIHDI